jgi:hypothetical protein
MNWSAILFQGIVNVVLPAAIYYAAIKKYPDTSYLPQEFREEYVEGTTETDSAGFSNDIPKLATEPGNLDEPEVMEYYEQDYEDKIAREKELRKKAIARGYIDADTSEENMRRYSKKSTPNSGKEDSYKALIEDTTNVRLVDSVPTWFPVSPEYLSLFIVVVMSLLCAATIVMNIVFAILGISLP